MKDRNKLAENNSAPSDAESTRRIISEMKGRIKTYAFSAALNRRRRETMLSELRRDISRALGGMGIDDESIARELDAFAVSAYELAKKGIGSLGASELSSALYSEKESYDAKKVTRAMSLSEGSDKSGAGGNVGLRFSAADSKKLAAAYSKAKDIGIDGYSRATAGNVHYAELQKEIRAFMNEFAEMSDSSAARSAAERRARKERQTDRAELEERGVRLVYVPSHANCSKRCQPYQGRIYSLDGTRGVIDGHKYVPIEEGTANCAGKTHSEGLFSYNCRHTMVEYERGMRVERIPDAVIEKARALETKQRAMERRIRKEREKRELHMAIYKATGDERAHKKATQSRGKAAQLRREYERFSLENDLVYYPDRLKVVHASENNKVLTDENGRGIIAVGGDIFDNFSRKAQLTDYTDDLKNTNPNYSSKEFKWMYNCQRCVPTYELRRRGYKVTAKPQPQNTEKDMFKDYISMKPWKVWKEPNFRNYKDKAEIEEAMAKMGDKARVQIIITLKTGGAHTFVAEQMNGKTVFVDPQTGDVDCSRYFTLQTGTGVFWRIDNLNPSDLITECCT